MDARMLITLLDESLDDIQANLTPVEWESFSQRLVQLEPRFALVQDETQLEDAADEIHDACLPYAYVLDLVEEADMNGCRKPLAAGETLAPEESVGATVNRVVNRFQDLVQRVKEAAISGQHEEESDGSVRE